MLDVKLNQIVSFCNVDSKLFFGGRSNFIYSWDHKNKRKMTINTQISNDIM